MNKRKCLECFALGLLLVLFFQNCSKNGIAVLEEPSLNAQGDSSTDIKDHESDDDIAVPGGDLPVESSPVDVLVKGCEDAKARGKVSVFAKQVTFEDTGKTCSWGVNGNLSIKNGYVRARTEQLQAVSLPTGATVCNIKMENIDRQNFRYDDNILLTLNQYILASTTNFSRHFTSSQGYYKYDWSRLVDKGAQNSATDTTIDKQYCAGGSEGFSECYFPKTETVGNIELKFDERVIQSILGITSANSLELGMVTTGDNDSTDCQHVPVRLAIEVEYY